MNITVNEDRTVIKEYDENEGSQNENRITELNFTLPEIYSDFVHKIVFITEDGNYSDYIEDNKYILKNNVTRYRKVKSFVWLTDSVSNKDFRSEVFQLEFNYNEDPSDYIPSEEEKSQIELLMDRLDELIQEVESLPSMSREVVEELPTTDIDPTVIYMVLREDTEPNNIYDEWLYINDAWEKIGSTDTDLADYVKNTDYATSNKGGVIKYNTINNAIGVNANGELYAAVVTYENYSARGNNQFISKGTLENEKKKKIGDIETLLYNINRGSGVE